VNKVRTIRPPRPTGRDPQGRWTGKHGQGWQEESHRLSEA
jgi:hypothetical protein